MKISSLIIGLLALLITAAHAQIHRPPSQNGTNSQTVLPTSTPYRVVSSDGNQDLWQSTDYFTNKAGKVIQRVHKFYEVATGLNYQKDGQWVAAREQIDVLPDGSAAATNGQHQAYFPGDLYEGNIALVTPDGKLLQSRPLGLSYDDGSNVVMIAELTNVVGQLIGNNQAIYTNAFVGLKADVLYTYKKSGFEQDIILRQQPPTPESLGLNPGTTKMQVLTEFFNPPDPVINQNMLPTDGDGVLPDQALDFGAMKMVPGRAFLMGTNFIQTSTNQVWVGKQWLKLGGRTVLAEEVRLDTVVAELSALPLTASLDKKRAKMMASNQRELPPQRLAKASYKGRAMQFARINHDISGFVLDYNTIIANTSDYVFRGDTTYYINGGYWLGGKTTIEGGAVFKCSTTNGSWVNIFGSLDCQTAPYRPAIFTTMDDNTVGEVLPGSSGNPTPSTNQTIAIYYNQNYYYFSNSAAVNIHDFQVRYLQTGIGVIDFGTTPHSTNEIRDCQFSAVYTPVVINGSPDYPMQMRVRNVLIENAVQGIFIYNHQRLSGENITMHHVRYRRLSNPSPTLVEFTNCLFVCATNLSEWNDTSSTMACTACATNTGDIGVFETAGAGAHYLPTNSPYRGAGTVSIDAGLLASLRQKTTYAPVEIAGTIFSAPVTWFPQNVKDTNANPDLGYHYPALDYVVSGCTVSNTTLSVTNGAIVALNGQFGLQLVAGGQLVSVGTPLAPNLFVRAVSVQEQPYQVTNGIVADVSGTATGLFSFTKFTCPAASGYDLYHAVGSVFASLNVQNCEFWGGANDVSGFTNSSVATLKNNLFWRSSLLATNTSSSASLYLTNNTFFGTKVTLNQPSGGLWSAFNNDFDSCTITGTLTNGYNAYLNSSGRLSPNDSHDIVSTNTLAYQVGPLGGFYLPGYCSLQNTGNTNANLLGLYQFTTQTNQSKDANSIVDIGYHYVACDTNGNPIASSGDGIPDYLEDLNGISNWQSAPAITRQPVSQSAVIGDDVLFTVVATGYPYPTYQWFYNGTTISGETNATLKLDNVQTNDVGSFVVAVSNPLGSVMSQPGALTSVSQPWGYVIVSDSLTNFVFQSDTTYYVNSTVQLFGTTTIEGGTVIKYGNHGTSQLVLNGSLNCKTGPYRPAILTSKDDNSVGGTISHSTGIPPTNYSAIYLVDGGGQTNDYNGLHIAYAGIGIWASSAVNVWDSQFLQCGTVVKASNNMLVAFHNVLIAQAINCVSTTGSVAAEFLTADQCQAFCPGSYSGAHLTNSLLTAVANTSGVGYKNSYPSADGSDVYQTSGGGHFYIKTNSAAFHSGTTSVSLQALVDIAQKTTQPPINIGGAGMYFTNNQNLFPQAIRDSGANPDIGYHYDPLDYIIGGIHVTNATITINAGTAIGVYSTNHCGYAIAIAENAHFISLGRPDNLVHIAQYNVVQEQTVSSWTRPWYAGVCEFDGDIYSINCQFTDWSVLAQDFPQLQMAGNGPFNFQNCQFHGGQIITWYPTLNFSNCLFERVNADIEPGDDNLPVFLNNTVFGGTFGYGPWNFDNAVIKNNFFDCVVISDWIGGWGWSYDGGNNAYVTNCDQLNPGYASDVILSASPAYQTSWLGNYYLPSASPLINAGSTNASQLGLFHFTTQTNQVKETNSIVDIGYHYVATDAVGNPLDSTGTGIPDYVKDANGNGVIDAGEHPWDLPVVGMRLWLKADVGTTKDTDNLISQWSDQSGNNNNAYQAVSYQKPKLLTNEINQLPAVFLNGTNNSYYSDTNNFFRLTNSFLNGITNAEVFVVVKARADHSGTYLTPLWEMGGATTVPKSFPDSDGNISDDFGSTTVHTVPKPTMDLAEFNIYQVSSLSGQWTAWMNGNQIFSTNVNTVIFPNDAGDPLFGSVAVIGAAPFYSSVAFFPSFFAGEISEILFYDRPLTAAERSSANSYLSDKYGLNPVISIIGITNNAIYAAGSNIIINASAFENSGGAIKQVEFFAGNQSLGVDNSSPYQVTWPSAAVGATSRSNFSLTARATGVNGIITTSSIVNISIDPPPTSVITSPTNNAYLGIFPANIAISVMATAWTGIQQVQLYQGTNNFATLTSTPYNYTWNNVAAGSYTITAVVTGNDGLITTSSAVHLLVDADTDGDGLGDLAEALYGGNPSSPDLFNLWIGTPDKNKQVP